MSLITWEPFTELGQFRRQFDALCDSFFAPSLRAEAKSWNPRCTTTEDEQRATLSVELPGVDEKDLAVELAGRQLTIKATRKTTTKDQDADASWSGSFTRSLTLPEHIDLAKIQATYAKGLLTIALPKLPQPKPKPIPITAA